MSRFPLQNVEEMPRARCYDMLLNLNACNRVVFLWKESKWVA